MGQDNTSMREPSLLWEVQHAEEIRKLCRSEGYKWKGLFDNCPSRKLRGEGIVFEYKQGCCWLAADKLVCDTEDGQTIYEYSFFSLGEWRLASSTHPSGELLRILHVLQKSSE